jgi:hypothetical protein
MRRTYLAAVLGAALALVAGCSEDLPTAVKQVNKSPAHVPSFATVQSTLGATFTTDKDDYSPGETLRLSGSGWQAGDVLDIHLDETPQNHAPVDWAVTVDGSGSFSDASYTVQDSDAGVMFTITATSRATGDKAEATFTDAPAPGSLCNTPSASTECAAATSLTPHNNTHYKVQAGATITGTIVGATDVSDGSVSVIIKSSSFGNTTLAGTASGGTITFSWTVPATGVCNTTIVAYRTNGNLANNIIVKAANGSPGASVSAAGYAITDANGDVITDCGGGGGGEAEIPTISKDAAGSYKNTYAWTITKDVDKTIVKQIGGSATFNYTVKVTHDGGTISDVKVTGTITVSNGNTADVTGADVTDALSNSTNCTVTGGANATLHPGDNTFPYTCSLTGVPSVPLDNKATVTWPAQTVGTASLAAGSPDFTVSNISFTENTVDETVSVTDTFGGTLGTATVGDANPKSFTYSRTISVPAYDCKSYDNTATFTTNDNGATGSAGQTVTVCGPARTGALTMGFWKGPNGNSLIASFCAPSAKPSLASWLAGLGAGAGPFSNATGTCSAMVTYVNGILNGASATNMNTMLKAQMLATALDVYFSTTTLGYSTVASGSGKNQIKPPSSFLSITNLGTFKMDLTAICPMVDNLNTGTATCLNNTPSTSAVAAGAVPSSPMAMQAILNFAATVGSSPWTTGAFTGTAASSQWYGTDRTKQEILKNIFDQFNNQLAFGSF